VTGGLSNTDLWDLFYKYENLVEDVQNADHQLAYATMASAVAKIISARIVRN
jgi:hypothetical protein